MNTLLNTRLKFSAIPTISTKSFAILCVVLFIPLLFINVRTSHDWGDDFALYIHQAGNIVEGKSQMQTGYVFNPDNPFVGPPTYSAGFPLMLAPVYACFGNNIYAFDIFLSLVLMGYGVLLVYFFAQYFNRGIAVLLALVILYNTWTLSFKCEIISDIPFAFMFLLAVLLYQKVFRAKIAMAMICGMAIAWAVLIKSTGIVLVLAMAIDMARQFFFQSNTRPKILKQGSIIMLSFLLTMVLFNAVLFRTGVSTFEYFKQLYLLSGNNHLLAFNANYYILELQEFFHPHMEVYEFMPLILKAFILTFFILHLINNTFSKPGFSEFLTWAFLLAILSFPNSTQGFRYLLPLLPFVLFYFANGLLQYLFATKINNYVLAGVLIAILATYQMQIKGIICTQANTLQGPQQPEAQALFSYLKTNTRPSDTVLFAKPRALALYTGRPSYGVAPSQDSISFERNLQTFSPKYVLQCNQMPNLALDRFVQHNQSKLVLVYHNSTFLLYQILPK